MAFVVPANGSELTEEAVKEFISKQVINLKIEKENAFFKYFLFPHIIYSVNLTILGFWKNKFVKFEQVVFYKRLHKVYFVHAIPKSASGKILRKDLRAKLAAYTS